MLRANDVTEREEINNIDNFVDERVIAEDENEEIIIDANDYLDSELEGVVGQDNHPDQSGAGAESQNYSDAEIKLPEQ